MQDGVKAMKSSPIYSKNKKTVILYIIAAVLFMTAACFGLMMGSVKLPISAMFSAFTEGAVTPDETIFLYSRLPRTLATLFVGAALSVSGTVLQSVLSNKLASPSIIGVNSGAALAVTVAAFFGIYGGFALSAIAFAGAFIAVAVLIVISLKTGRGKSTVILTGVALNALFGAFSDALISFNPSLSIFTYDFKIGDFSAVTYNKLVPGIIIISLSLVCLFFLSDRLDILSMGDNNAKALGMNVTPYRILFLILVALLSGVSVSLAGLISFIGLIVPHALRYSGVKESKSLLPLSALFGGGFVSLSDTFARTLFSPYEIPVGIIMAFWGVPFFIFLLSGKKGGEIND